MRRLLGGDLRHRLIIRRATETDNGKGGFTTAWASVATVRAEVQGLDGRESVMAEALQGVSVFRIRIRWRSDIRSGDQFRDAAGSCFGTDNEGAARDVNIRSISDPDGRRRQLVIIADTSSTRS